MNDAFIVAIALVAIIEGLLPFLAPERYLSFLENMKQLTPSQLRMFGGLLLISGSLLLFWVS